MKMLEDLEEVVPGELDKTAPEIIWLQIDTSESNKERDELWPGDDGVTWCSESIGGLEIQYVRADFYTDMAKRLEATERDAASAAPVAWMIEWDSEDDGRKCCPRKGQDKPRLDCFPEGTTAYPLFATSQQTSAVPRRTGER